MSTSTEAHIGLAAASADADVLSVASALGFLGFFCLAAAVVWGIATAVGPWAGRIDPDAVQLGHLAWAVAGLTFVGGHVVAHTLRPEEAFSWPEALVPFARGGITVATGVLGLLVLVIAATSFVVRTRIGVQWWTAVHRAAYAGFALMALHVVLAADEVAGLTWVGVAAMGVMAAVSVLSVLRWRRAAHREHAIAAGNWGLDP